MASSAVNTNYELAVIGYVRSPYKEKFIVPRQPNLVNSIKSSIELIEPYNNADAVRGLENFSHLWVLFLFHQNMTSSWKPLVRPPRLGGNRKLGVFATRSSFRPNSIGMSPVELVKIENNKNNISLHINGGDMVDGTPVIDIKPYIPYVDSISIATEGYAAKPQPNVKVEFSELAGNQLKEYGNAFPQLEESIIELIQQDPRPGYRRTKQEAKQYAFRLYDFDIQFEFKTPSLALVTSVKSD